MCEKVKYAAIAYSHKTDMPNWVEDQEQDLSKLSSRHLKTKIKTRGQQRYDMTIRLTVQQVMTMATSYGNLSVSYVYQTGLKYSCMANSHRETVQISNGMWHIQYSQLLSQHWSSMVEVDTTQFCAKIDALVSSTVCCY